MKKSELRQIIKEEISKIKEEEGFDYSHFKYVEGDLYDTLENLEDIESKIEKYGPTSNELRDAIEALQALIKNINPDFGNMDI
jgi:predicted RNase H-like nuclease (RuvC/YqgF family)